MLNSLGKRVIFLFSAVSIFLSAEAANVDNIIPAPHDHSGYEELKGPFTTAFEVTEACLSCHENTADEIHATSHWQWKSLENENLGKYSRSLNNFCIATPGSEAFCTSCHIGYGWKDPNFDFSSNNAIDCLVCHDTTGLYTKQDAGMPKLLDKPDGSPTFLDDIALNVGTPGRDNCGGACHFKGGGGDGVKHGDLDSSLTNPPRELDVHMAADGANFACQECHTTREHQVAGRSYTTPAFDEFKSLVDDHNMSKLPCTSCHSDTPHKDKLAAKLNDHTDTVACQTCHIPALARGGLPTKVSWDWSTAGKLKDGKPYEDKNEEGKTIYASKKGDFIWEHNVAPVYFWYNGAMSYITIDDKIDDSQRVTINHPLGDVNDPRARIMPFKRHIGKQPYDTVNMTMLQPDVAGNGTEEADAAAFWKHFNWANSLAVGTKIRGQEFSGEFDFIDTEFFYPSTHMVAPKEDALKCAECHNANGRLKDVAGVYMPAQKHFEWIEILGWLMVGFTTLVSIIHLVLRIINRRRG